MKHNRTNSVVEITKVDYGSVGLRGNPFPIAGLSTSQSPYPLIDPRMDKEVRDFINQTIQSQEYCGLVVLGEFGSGKTYALRYIETLVETLEMRADAEEVLAIYVEHPRPTLIALVADVCNRIGRARFRNILLEMIFADFARVVSTPTDPDSSERLKKVKSAYLQSAHRDLFATAEPLANLTSAEAILNPAAVIDRIWAGGGSTEFLIQFGTDSLGLILGKKHSSGKDVARHFAEFALSDDARAAAYWKKLLAGNLCFGTKVVAGISGQDIWHHVVEVLRHAGYKMVYLLIDEFEESDYQQAKQASLRAFLADLRDLIDSNLEGFALVIASKVNAWDVCRALNPAFTQRFSRSAVLASNSVTDLKKMISERVKQLRSVSSNDPLAPFTESAIKALQKLSRGNTRVAVQACHILLWHAASIGGNQVDEKMVGDLNNISRTFYYARGGH